jgi:hypothetical protein
MKFGGGGAAGLFGCSVLICKKELFNSSGVKRNVRSEQTPWSLRTSTQVIKENDAVGPMDRVSDFERKGAYLTWQRTEILLPALLHLK